MSEVPVVFIIFNRPLHTARVFERIRRARPEHLYIISDGPRADRPGEEQRVREVRELVEGGVDWPCTVVRDYAQHNMGCGSRLSSGISAAFRLYEQAIILEDDCLPEDSFFPFCAELLERYRDDWRVGQIGGANCHSRPALDGSSYHYSRFTHCWGWATWRRAWAHYQYEVAADAASYLPASLPPQARRSLARSLREIRRGKLDTWDYQWTHACMRHGMYSVIPSVNLVSNIGFGEGATHTASAHPVAALECSRMVFPLHHPLGVAPCDDSDLRTARLLYWRPGPGERLLRSVRRRLVGVKAVLLNTTSSS